MKSLRLQVKKRVELCDMELLSCVRVIDNNFREIVLYN